MTKEEKAAKRAFFALYIDQVVWRSHYAEYCTAYPVGLYGTGLGKDEYLELTDLRNITDEHAIAICRMAVHDHVEYPSHHYLVTKENDVVIVKIDNDWFSEEIRIGCRTGAIWSNTLMFSRPSPMYWDDLRKNGYAVPFRSYSVEDLVRMGWAKIKQQ